MLLKRSTCLARGNRAIADDRFRPPVGRSARGPDWRHRGRPIGRRASRRGRSLFPGAIVRSGSAGRSLPTASNRSREAVRTRAREAKQSSAPLAEQSPSGFARSTGAPPAPRRMVGWRRREAASRRLGRRPPDGAMRISAWRTSQSTTTGLGSTAPSAHCPAAMLEQAARWTPCRMMAPALRRGAPSGRPQTKRRCRPRPCEDGDMEDGTTRARINPDVGERFLPLRRRLGVSSFGMNQIVLEPGQRGRIHRHQRQEEVYLVLEGRLDILIDGEESELGASELIRVAPGVRLTRQPGPGEARADRLERRRRARGARWRGVYLMGRRDADFAAGPSVAAGSRAQRPAVTARPRPRHHSSTVEGS